MNARPYILGCLCLLGANGNAVASDIDLTGGLLSSMSGAVSSTFEGSSVRSGQGSGRDTSAGDVSTRPVAATPRATAPSPVPSPADADDDMHDMAPSSHSSSPSWQTMLPGSIF